MSFIRIKYENSAALKLGVDNLVGLHLELARGGNGDGRRGAVAGGSGGVLNGSDHLHALHNSAENNVAVIQPGGLDSGNEELGSVGVLAGVGHAQDSGAGVAKLEVLVLKLVSIDRLAASSVAVSEVASLDHEFLDDTVEGRSSITKALGALRELEEVLSSLGDSLSKETDNNTTNGLAILLHVKVDLVGDDGALCSLSRDGEDDDGKDKDQGTLEGDHL